jgi:ABC-type lipoprotein release transport system permease subunit
MDEWTNNPMNGVTVVLALVVIVLFIRVSIVSRRMKKLRKQYVEVMGNTGITNLEDVIIDLKQSITAQELQSEKLQKQLEQVKDLQQQEKGRVGVLRYNAFSDKGSDLSFSIAVVNASQDGVVISGLHSRDNTYVYAKPINKGESNYTLTPEERKAIAEAK